MADITRRSVLLAVGVAAGLPAAGGGLKIVVVGAHPDDPESSCGGTMARYSDSGNEVVALYLTRGEAGIPGKTAVEAAAIRTAEAQRACAILKARAVFAGQVDGKTEVNEESYRAFRSLILAEKPDVLFAPWPIDSHRDHRAASLLAYDAWERGGRRFELYYTEVDLGGETKNFQPTNYVDITAVVERKRQACFAHSSQNPPSFYDRYHEPMQRLRGLENGCQAAEAFAALAQNPRRCSLPA
jgi:N-acetylglucosamine malate deacetylase 1